MERVKREKRYFFLLLQGVSDAFSTQYWKLKISFINKLHHQLKVT